MAGVRGRFGGGSRTGGRAAAAAPAAVVEDGGREVPVTGAKKWRI
jgi:hypothetical protein